MKEALKLALEALEHWDKWSDHTPPKTIEAITAIKEALAQPAQEPVAWLEPEWREKICPEVGYEVTMTDDHPRDLCWIPLYPHPPQRTEQEPVAWLDEEEKIIYWHNTHETDDYHGFRRTTPLYTTPQQRPWVGLTEQELESAYWDYMEIATQNGFEKIVKAIETKLKEKNSG